VSKSVRVLAVAAAMVATAAIPVGADAATPAAVHATTVTHATAVKTAVAPKKYANCAALNKVYKHGVAKKKGVVDKTKGKRVTTYTVNLKVYNLNYTRLDRDRDGIACEKR
jgi:hypothetical protein